MGEDVTAQIGDDALAKRHDKVVARRARQREQASDTDHDQEIAVDKIDAAPSESKIDHAAHGDRHNQRGKRRED